MKYLPGLLASGNWLQWGSRKTNHLNTYPCVLMFISMLSLRRGEGGGADRALYAADRIGFVCDEWGCQGRWQVCVQYMWMYNTLCIPWQAGRLFFVLIISISFHLRLLTADVVTEGWATAAAHRLSVLWKAEKWDTMLMTDVFRCFICPCCFQSHWDSLESSASINISKAQQVIRTQVDSRSPRF